MGGSVIWRLISKKADNAPVQRSGKRRFKRSERDGKKGQSKVGMKVELVARSWIGNCESVRIR